MVPLTALHSTLCSTACSTAYRARIPRSHAARAVPHSPLRVPRALMLRCGSVPVYAIRCTERTCAQAELGEVAATLADDLKARSALCKVLERPPASAEALGVGGNRRRLGALGARC
jgi:hypothetical protein